MKSTRATNSVRIVCRQEGLVSIALDVALYRTLERPKKSSRNPRSLLC